MKFVIQVNEGPYNHEASTSALNFTRAALDAGHEVFRVFFYHDGVNNATRYTTPPQDDRNITQQWHSQHNFTANVPEMIVLS